MQAQFVTNFSDPAVFSRYHPPPPSAAGGGGGGGGKKKILQFWQVRCPFLCVWTCCVQIWGWNCNLTYHLVVTADFARRNRRWCPGYSFIHFILKGNYLKRWSDYFLHASSVLSLVLCSDSFILISPAVATRRQRREIKNSSIFASEVSIPMYLDMLSSNLRLELQFDLPFSRYRRFCPPKPPLMPRL